MSGIQMNPVFGCPVFGWLLYSQNTYTNLKNMTGQRANMLIFGGNPPPANKINEFDDSQNKVVSNSII